MMAECYWSEESFLSYSLAFIRDNAHITEQREKRGSDRPVHIRAIGAQLNLSSKESIPPAYVAWRADTTTLFLFGS